MALCGPSQSQRMDLDLTQRVSPSVHPKAELALAALQMRLRGARCTKEGRKDQKRILQRRLSSSSSYFFSVPLSLICTAVPANQPERRAHLAHSLLGLPRANVASSSSSAQRNLVSTHTPPTTLPQSRGSARPGPDPATTLEQAPICITRNNADYHVCPIDSASSNRDIRKYSTAAMKSKSRNRFRERVSLIFRPVLWHAITRKRPLSVLSSFFRWSLKMCALLDQPLGRP